MGTILWRSMVPEDGDEIVAAVQYLNRFEWNITWRESAEGWSVFSGERPLFEASTWQEVEAFIQGMMVSLAVLPPNIQEQIIRLVSD